MIFPATRIPRNIVVTGGDISAPFDADPTVWAADELVLIKGIPTRRVLALTNVNEDERKLQVSVAYNQDLRHWSLRSQSQSPVSPAQYRILSLDDALSSFERLIGVTLPLIRVIEKGGLMHSAQGRDRFLNYFSLINGKRYHIVDTHAQAVRPFAVSMVEKHPMIAFDDAPQELIDPAQRFTVDEWQSLTLIG